MTRRLLAGAAAATAAAALAATTLLASPDPAAAQAPTAAVAADAQTPAFDVATQRWWLWDTTSTPPRPVAWWNGQQWVPTSIAPASPARAVERRGQHATVAGRTVSYDLLGAPSQLAGLVVYLDGDGMNAVDNPARAPLGGSGGLVDVAARHGMQTLVIRTPSADGTWWRDLNANAALVDELTRRIAADTGAARVALVGYSGGAQLIAKGLLGRGLCTSVAVIAGGGGTDSPPTPPSGSCAALWATGTADTGPGSSDGYNALRDARAGSGAYASAGWPAMIWTPDGVDHDAIRAQIPALLDFQLAHGNTSTTAPAPSATATPAPTTSSTPAPGSTSTSSTASSFTGQTLSGALTTQHWPGKTVNWLVATPNGIPKGTVVVLHGKTDSAKQAFDGLGLDKLAKSTGYALAAIDGESTFWANDGAGIDTGAMIIDDFLPLLASKGLPVDKVALTGYSMGGLGALTIAQQLGPQRVTAVMPMSAAVWDDGTHPGVEGQAQARVRADVGRLAGIPVRIVSGTLSAHHPDSGGRSSWSGWVTVSTLK